MTFIVNSSRESGEQPLASHTSLVIALDFLKAEHRQRRGANAGDKNGERTTGQSLEWM